MNPQKILKFILLSFISLFALIIVFLSMQWFSNKLSDILISPNNFLQSSLETPFEKAQAITNQKPITNQNLSPLRDGQIDNLKIEARSAISVEVGPSKTNILFKKNEEEKLPIASLTKLMTTKIVLDNYDLSEKVTISDLAMAQEGEQGVLKLGETLSVKDLLYITLMESSNRSAFAISEVMGTKKFIELMNSDAQKMGLLNTHFENVTGLNEGSYSTVQDLVKLSKYLFENYPLFKEITGLKEYDLYLDDGTFHHKLVNTNQFLGKNNIVGGKTGFTEIARGCFMVIQESKEKGNHIISIVLGSEDRFSEMEKIINWLNIAYKWQ